MRYPERINKILPRVMKSMNLEKHLKELELVKSWHQVVGKKIAHHTQAININDGALFVVVDNPVWQAQLSLLKNKIIQRFNKMGANLKDIRFLIKKGGSPKE